MWFPSRSLAGEGRDSHSETIFLLEIQVFATGGKIRGEKAWGRSKRGERPFQFLREDILKGFQGVFPERGGGIEIFLESISLSLGCYGGERAEGNREELRDGAFERRTREREQGGLRLEQRGEFLESLERDF